MLFFSFTLCLLGFLATRLFYLALSLNLLLTFTFLFGFPSFLFGSFALRRSLPLCFFFKTTTLLFLALSFFCFCNFSLSLSLLLLFFPSFFLFYSFPFSLFGRSLTMRALSPLIIFFTTVGTNDLCSLKLQVLFILNTYGLEIPANNLSDILRKPITFSTNSSLSLVNRDSAFLSCEDTIHRNSDLQMLNI